VLSAERVEVSAGSSNRTVGSGVPRANFTPASISRRGMSGRERGRSWMRPGRGAFGEGQRARATAGSGPVGRGGCWPRAQGDGGGAP
jgi:hypothetical protein